MKINYHERYQPKNQTDLLMKVLFASSKDQVILTKDRLDALVFNNYGMKDVIWTSSATTALEGIFRLLHLKKDDEVIIPSFTFPSCANAVILSGGKVVFSDIEEETQNVTVDALERVFTKNTKALVCTHYGGVSCNMDEILKWAKDRNVLVIEDAAQAVHSKYKDKYLGTMGIMASLSFHESKNFSSSEGGALIINDHKYLKEAEIITENGTSRKSFMRGEIDEYSWQKEGTNSLMSSFTASLLLPQLLDASLIVEKRRRIHNVYEKVFREEKAEAKGVTLMKVPSYAYINYHIYYILLEDENMRDKVKDYLKGEGIDARTHFVPLHRSPYGKALGYKEEDLPKSIASAKRILRLPIHTEMTLEDGEMVAFKVMKGLKSL